MGKTNQNHLLGAILLLALWSCLIIWRYWNTYAIDLAAIYIAGHLAWAGDLAMIYGGLPEAFAVKNAPEWRQVLIDQGITGESGSHYVYPPLWAFVVSPFSGYLDPYSFFNAGRTLLTLSLAASVLLTWRLTRVTLSPLYFAAIAIFFFETTIPAVLALELGQPQLFVILLMLLAMERYVAGSDLAAGAALGLAAAIKVTPILLIVIFLADRRWRAASTTILVSGALAGLSFALAGLQPHLTFIEGVRWMESLMPAVGLNMTFETVMHDWIVPFAPCERCTDPRMGLDTPWVSVVSRLLMFAIIGATLWATASLNTTHRTIMRFCILSVAILFFGPLAWMHYYTLIILLFLGIAPRLRFTAASLAAILLWAGFSQIWMGTLLSNTADIQSAALYPQHTAILSIIVFIAVCMAEIARSPKQSGQSENPQSLPN